MPVFLGIVLLLISIMLVLIILVQRGRGGGLSGAFGMGGGGGGSAFGTKTGDVFTTITVVLFVVFMLLAISLNYVFKANPDSSSTSQPAAVDPTKPLTDLPSGGSFPLGTPTSLPAK